MEQHIKTRLAVRLLEVRRYGLSGARRSAGWRTYVSISLAVALSICLSQCSVWAGEPPALAQATAGYDVHAFYYPWYGSVVDAAPDDANPRTDKFYYHWSHQPPFLLAQEGTGVKKGGAVQPTRYMIVVTGGELLSGVYPDGHTYFLTRTLRPLGLQCVGSMSVDDKQADLKEALRYAADKAALVIVTGGLGPTDNDITREALCDFTGITLKEHPEVLQKMAQRFHVSPAQLRSNLRRQTQVPTRGTYFKNPEGTAVGLVFELADAPSGTGQAVIVALPGPPRELQAMVSDELVPYLSRRFGTRLPGCSLTLRFVGLGQSQIDQTLKDHVPLASDITVSSQFQGGRVDFTFSLPNDTQRDRARLKELKHNITAHLGEYIYADGEISLEEHVLKLLETRGATLVLAEVGSGGSLTAALSSADGAHRILAGAYVAPTMEQLRRLLHVRDDRWTDITSRRQRIERLATAAADATGSQWAVAVGEAWRDESDAGYVDVAFKLSSGRLENQQVRFRGLSGARRSAGELARSRLSTQLLDQLRRRLR